MNFSTVKQWLRLIVVFSIAAVFLYLAFGKLDWSEVFRALAEIKIALVLLTLPVLAAVYFVRIFRWWWMLKKVQPDIVLRDCAGPLLASYAINNTVPLRAGDIVRAVAFRKKLNSPAMRLLGTIGIERILDLFVVLLFFSVTVAVTQPAGIPEGWSDALLWLAAILLSSIAVLILLLRPMDTWLHKLEHRSAQWRPAYRFVLDKARHLLDALALLGSMTLMLQLLALTLFVWLLEGSIFLLVAYSLELNLATLASWFVMATGALATAIPSSPGHLGTFDYFVVEALSVFGTQREVAGVFAIVVHMVLWLPGTAVGGLYLLYLSRARGKTPLPSDA